MDPRVSKLADLLVNYSVAVQPDDLVLVRFNTLAEEAGLEVYREVLKAGGNPIVQMLSESAAEVFYKTASDMQLEFLNPVESWLVENVDVRITLGAVQNSKALTNIDPTRMSIARKANAQLTETFMRRQSSGDLRWTGTRFPSHAAAQDAEMSLSDYEDFVYQACMVHLDNPVAYWQQKSVEQQRLVDWLKGKEHIEVKGEHIDLTLSIADRVFINADGKKNMPDGEIFTGPVEDSVNGWVKFTFPAVYGGREVDGVELRFENGEVVHATAEKGEDFLNSVLDTDERSRYLGEFAIGTNEFIQQFTRSILFDEKIGGTVHMAVGAGYPDTGSVNKSAIHWDMICDMRSGGQIYVDGALFYQDGEFKV
nr:aminopeptidase [Anaerolineae bacterium]